MTETKQNRYNQQNLVTPAPIVRRMSAEESAALQQWAQTAQSINIEQAFAAQLGADERTSGMDRSTSLLVRMIPLFGLWFILSIVVMIVLYSLVEAGETFSVVMGLVLFVWMSYNSYSGADERERYDSRNGVEHHRIDVAENLTLKRMSHDYELKRLALAATLKQLEIRKDDDY